MDYRAWLEAQAKRLVGRRIVRVRYDLMTCDVWDEFGPTIDVALDSLLLDLDGDEPAYLTWSNESGVSYGVAITYARHWVDIPGEDRGDGWDTIDVTATSRWREVAGIPIVEARVVWWTSLSEEFPPSAVTRTDGFTFLDRTKAVPATIASVPQEIAFRFASGRWLVISAARYHGEGKGFWASMDELLVVHDEDFMRHHGMGQHAGPSREAPP